MHSKTKPLVNHDLTAMKLEGQKVPGSTFGSRNRSVNVVSSMSSNTDAMNRTTTGFGKL